MLWVVHRWVQKNVWGEWTVCQWCFFFSIIDLNQYLRLVYKCRRPLLVLSTFWFFCVSGCADYTMQVFLHLCVGRQVLLGDREREKKSMPAYYKVVGISLLQIDENVPENVTCENWELLSCNYTTWLLHRITKEHLFRGQLTNHAH